MPLRKRTFGLSLLTLLWLADCRIACEPAEGSAPEPPTGLTAKAVSPRAVAITWKSSPHTVVYTLYRSDPSSASFVELGGLTVNSYTDAALAPGTTYRYYVTALNAKGESAHLAPVVVTTPAQ